MDEIVIEQYHGGWFGNVIGGLEHFYTSLHKSIRAYNVNVISVSKNEKGSNHKHQKRREFIDNHNSPKRVGIDSIQDMGSLKKPLEILNMIINPIKQGLKHVRSISCNSNKTRMRGIKND